MMFRLQQSYPKYFPLLPYALLIVAVLLAYANIYGFEFVYDDLGLIEGNKFLTSWKYAPTLFTTSILQGHGVSTPFYRPLQMLLYMFVYQGFGASPAAFHFLNVLLHISGACLLYALGVRLGFNRIASFLAVLLWAVHPAHIEAVTYISGTAGLLGLLFLTAGVYVLVPNFSPKRVGAACLFFVLALLSKESAVIFPLLAMGLLFYRSPNRWSPRTYISTWPFWLIAALYLIARGTVLGFDGFYGYYNPTAADTLATRLYTFLATLPSYIQLLVWPTDLHIERSFPVYQSLLVPQVLGGLVLLAAAIVCVVYKPSRPATPLAWGLLWAAATHIPQSGILVPAGVVFYDHWLHLPMAGLALGLAQSLMLGCKQVRLRQILAGAAVLAAILLGTATFQQNKVWKDSVTLYTHILGCGENSVKIRNNLGNYYLKNQQYDLALEQYKQSLALSDYSAEAHFSLAATMLAIGVGPEGVAESEKHILRALELNPELLPAYDEMALLYAQLGNGAKESAYRAKAAEIRKKMGID
ncbi:MAG: hypothetical protein WC464_07730 [Bdellovibrionales bacterium]